MWSAFARRASARQPSLDTFSLACRAEARPQSERRLERETGIEPATNSLEGCDSTTELLPPSRLARFAVAATAGKPARAFQPRFTCPAACSRMTHFLSPVAEARRSLELPSSWLANRSSRSERRLVAREGFEPSKPLGRQIYSLLRLTASLPRRYPPADAPGLTLFVLSFLLSGFSPLCDSCRPASSRLCRVSRVVWRGGSVELAKGFEPPTG